MGFKPAAVHRMLNHFAGNAATGGPATHASLHTGFPATDGNEITGGTPAYVRKALTYEAVAGTELAGSLDVTAAPVFDVPAGDVAAIGFYTASTAGTLMADSPAGAGPPKPFTVDDASTDVLDSKAHGYTNGQTVIVLAVVGGTIPAGLVANTKYWVRDVTTDTLKLAATPGGAAVDITAVGAGLLQLTVVETFAGQGTYTLTDADFSISV